MPLNVAFYGAGELAQPYLEALARRDDVRVTAVCDADLRACELAAAGWGARVFPHPDGLFAEARPDVLWVAVPPRLQGGVLEQAAARRIPFFVEPPGAADFAAAQRIHDRVAADGLVAAVGYAARQADVIREAREYLGANPVPLALGWWLTGGEVPGQTAAELLWNEGCRLLDLVRFFCGEPVRVGALAAGARGLTVLLQLAGGAAVTLALAGYEMIEPRAELELQGEGWYFRFLDGLTTLRLAEREKTTIIRQANRPHQEMASAFLEAVRGRKPAASPCGYAEAFATMRVCHAVLQAAASGRWLELA